MTGHAGQFDVIFCMEVCEHLSDSANSQLLQNIRTLLNTDGCAVFGVPIEIHFSGLLKNLYRTLKGNRQGARLVYAIRSLFGLPIPRVFDEHGWTHSHLGFSHQDLKMRIQSYGFKVNEKRCLPWPILGASLNNEVYFICSVNK